MVDIRDSIVCSSIALISFVSLVRTSFVSFGLVI